MNEVTRSCNTLSVYLDDGAYISVPDFYKSNLPPCTFEEEFVAFGCCAAVEFPQENALRPFLVKTINKSVWRQAVQYWLCQGATLVLGGVPLGAAAPARACLGHQIAAGSHWNI